jgi:hypothetical protein
MAAFFEGNVSDPNAAALRARFAALEAGDNNLSVGSAYRSIARLYMASGNLDAAEKYGRLAIGTHHNAVREAQTGDDGAPDIDIANHQFGMSIRLAGMLALCRAGAIMESGAEAGGLDAHMILGRFEAERDLASRLFAIAAEALGPELSVVFDVSPDRVMV